jgi:hypothetical protein
MINKLFKGLPESVRQTITAGFPLFLVIIFFIFVGKYSFSKVADLRSQIGTAQNSEMVLTQKLSVLQTISTTAESGARAASLAVPATNPSLIVVSQLRNLAISNGVILSAIKSTSGAANTNGLDQAIISFTVDGARPQVFSFLAGIDKIAPISLVDKIRMTEGGGALRADIGIKTFWAEFPKTIPSVTTPISDLTTGEKETLTKILGLIQPNFTEVAPSQGAINPNPFGL